MFLLPALAALAAHPVLGRNPDGEAQWGGKLDVRKAKTVPFTLLPAGLIVIIIMNISRIKYELKCPLL